jgi:hypothetical protein
MNRLLARFPLVLCLFVAALAAACGDDDSTDTSGQTGNTGDTAGSTETTGSTTDTSTETGGTGGPTDTGDTADTGGTTGDTIDTGETGDTADAGETGETGETDGTTGVESNPYPAPDAWPANRGPGIGKVSFTDEQLYKNCAYLDGGEKDKSDHHNLVVMYDGYLLMPWAPEFGQGGLTFFDISQPCTPTVVGTGWSEKMRESHSIGFSTMGGRWAVVDSLIEFLLPGGTGVEFWDVSDPTAPVPVSQLGLPGSGYPDAYVRVTLSVFWQAPYVYVGGADNGVYVIDATDPRNPKHVNTYKFDPVLRVGQVQAIGNLLIATQTEGPRVALLDISNPVSPQPISEFQTLDENGETRECYFTNVANGHLYCANKKQGGGIQIYDINDPENPTRLGGYRKNGNGGYVFIHEDYAFSGESDFAMIYDISDPTSPTPVARFELKGDLDTFTPIGHLAFPSVDDKAEKDKATAIAPWQKEPDSVAPRATWFYPPDGATDLALTSRFGIGFSESVDPASAFEGSVRLYETGTDPALTRVEGVVSAQEVLVNFWPLTALKPNTQYTLEIPAGGIVDYAGNPVTEARTVTFTTGGAAR